MKSNSACHCPPLVYAALPTVRLCGSIGCLLGMLVGGLAVHAQAPQPGRASLPEKVDFQRDVLPILQAHCLACHSASRSEGGLVLETPQAMRAGGARGPAVVPGKPQESLLVALASGASEPAMPPPDNEVGARPLAARALELLRRWIEQGAEGSVAARPAALRWRQPPKDWQPGWAVRFSSDDALIAFSRGTQLFVHHAQSGRLVTQLTDPALGAGQADRDSVRALAFDPRGELLAAAGYKTVRLWRRPKNVQRWQWAMGGGEPARADDSDAAAVQRGVLAASPDGSRLAVGLADGTIRTFAAGDGQPGATLTGHTDAVSALHYSADGGTLYSAAFDGTVRVWDAAVGRQLRRLCVPDPVHHLAVLDDRTIATSSGDGFVQFWRLERPASVRIARLAGPVTALAVAAEDRAALVAGRDGRVRRLALEQPTISTLARRRPRELHCVAIWPDGSRAALTAAADVVDVVSLAASETLATLFVGQGQVTDVAVHPQGHLLAVGTNDGLVRLWRLDAAGASLGEASSPPTAAALSGDGRWLATAEQSDGRPAAVVRDLQQGVITHLLLGHAQPIRALAFSPDALRLATASEDGTIRLWNLADPRMPELAMLTAHDGPATAVAFADGQTVLTAGADGRVCAWSINQLAEPVIVATHQGGVTGLALHQSSVVSVGGDGVLRIAPLAAAAAARTIELAGPCVGLALSVGTARAAVALDLSANQVAAHAVVGEESCHGAIQIIDLESASIMQTLRGQMAPPHALALNPDGTRLVAADATRVTAWDVQQGCVLSGLHVPPCKALLWQSGADVLCITAEGTLLRAALAVERVVAAHQAGAHVAWSVDGNRLISAGSDGTLRGWDLELQPAFETAVGAAAFEIAVSPVGNLIAVACDDGRLCLCDLGGNPVRELAAFAGSVNCAAFSPDGRYAAGGDAQGQVRLFDVQEGRCVQVYAGHSAAITGVGMYVASGDEEGEQLFVVSSSEDGTVRRNALLATHRIQAHEGTVAAMAGAAGRLLTGGGSLVRQWSAQGQLLRQFDLGGEVRVLAARADGMRLAAAGEGGAARLWNPEDGQQLAELRGDFRLAAEAERLARQTEILQARLSANEELLAQAQNDSAPRAAEAESRQGAFAAAERMHADRMLALQTALAALQEAQAAAFDAARQARQAQRELADAARQIEKLEKAAARAEERAERARRAAAAAPNDDRAAAAFQAAEREVQLAAEHLQQARDALAMAEQRVATLAPLAEQAQARVAELVNQADQAQSAAQEAMAAMLEARRAAEDAAAAHREAQAMLESSQALKTTLQQALDALRARQQTLEADYQASLRPVMAVAFCEGRFATGGENGVVYLWHDDTGRPADVVETGPAPVHDLAFVSGGLATVAGGHVTVWELDPAWPLERLLGGEEAELPADRVLALDFSPDGTLLATAGGEPSRSGELALWDVASGRLLAQLADAHSDTILAAAFSPDGRYLATGAADRLLKVFSVPELRELYRFEGHAHHILAVAWRGDGERLASAGAEGVVRIWNPHAGEPLIAIEGLGKPVTSLRFLPGTSSVISGCGDKLLRQHEIDGGNLLRVWEHADYVNALDLSGNGQYLAAIDHAGSLRIWHIESSQLVHVLEPARDPPDGEAPAAETP